MNLLLRQIVVGLLLAAVACGDVLAASVSGAVKQLEKKAAEAPPALSIEFRVKAAQAVHTWPELSRELTARCVAELRSGVGRRITPDVMGALTRLDPDGAVSVLPQMDASYAEPVIDALGQLHRIDDARSVYRAALLRGSSVSTAFPLLIQLHNEKSGAIGAVYRDMLSGFSFDALEPQDAY